MAFELVRRIFGQAKSSHSRTHEPTMENASLDDQQGETVHGIRDITNTAEFNWSELARATQDEWKGRTSYSGAMNVGLEPSTFHIENERPNSPRCPNTPRSKSSCSDEEEIVVRVRTKKATLDEIPSSTTHPNWEDYPEPIPSKPIHPHIVLPICRRKASLPQAAEEWSCYAS